MSQSARATAQDAKEAVQETADNVKSEAKGWFNWGSSKADEAKVRAENEARAAKEGAKGLAYDTKEAAKSALLRVEEATEHGAQKAQQETKKL